MRQTGAVAGPSGVFDQSNWRMRSAISPLLASQSFETAVGGLVLRN